MTLCPDWLTPDADPFTPLLWPLTATRPDGVLSLGGLDATDLANKFGTPVYVLDEADFHARAAGFRRAFAPWNVYYASKAFLTTAVARWVAEDGLGIDVCSPAELTMAIRAGVDPARVALHGNNKSDDLLRAGLAAGVGRIVIDSDDEIDRLVSLIAVSTDAPVPVMIRVTPDVAAHTHAHVQTAVADQKFGFALAGGVALAAMRRLAATPGVDLRGVHCHVGSQILDLDSHLLAAQRLIDLLAQFAALSGRELPECDLGGGFGIAYTVADRPMTPDVVASGLKDVVESGFRQAGLNVPSMSIEPGRAIVGPSVVALYRVGAVKTIELPEGERTYVAVDGGLSDNVRPTMYQAEYTALLANRESMAPPRLSRVVGQHCDSGDMLVLHTYLPSDVHPGDLIAVPASGAYQRAMASNYNGRPRPPVVAVRDGAAHTLLRRETIDDLLSLEVG